jgi:hypothetical protein
LPSLIGQVHKRSAAGQPPPPADVQQLSMF